METTSHIQRAAQCLVILLGVAMAALSTAPSAPAYGWPVKPFHRQHPIRSYFGDPRIGTNLVKPAFVHFGVDISAPNNAPVYATISGQISLHPLHPDSVVMVTSGDTTFEYWHLHPALTSGHAVAYKTVLGTIVSPCLHVHFSERHGSTYVNPLRAGGLGPYRDTTRPRIGALLISHDGAGYDVSVEAHDLPPVAVPSPWNDLPLTPALVQWRVRAHGGAYGPWTTVVDFRGSLPTASIDAVFAPSTRQNRAGLSGRYHFPLLDDWRPSVGTYVIDVRVADTVGNRAERARIVRASAGHLAARDSKPSRRGLG